MFAHAHKQPMHWPHGRHKTANAVDIDHHGHGPTFFILKDYPVRGLGVILGDAEGIHLRQGPPQPPEQILPMCVARAHPA